MLKWQWGAVAILTVGEIGVVEPQLQAGGGWVFFGSIWRVQQLPQVPAQRLQQALQQGVVGLICHMHEILYGGRRTQRHYKVFELIEIVSPMFWSKAFVLDWRKCLVG